MKALLIAINAKYIHSNPAIYDLKAFCQSYQEEIELVEYTINHYKDEILMDIYKRKPEMIAFSCYIWNIDFVRALGRDLGKVLPHIPIWLGGPEVSYEYESFLESEKWATGIMVGEGEQTFLELMAYYQEGIGQLSQISGLVYRETEGRIRCNLPRRCIQLDQLPFAYEDLSEFTHRIIYYETSRGCPFSCTYCLSSIDKQVRFKSLELVKKELNFFLEKKVRQVKFVDRTFNCNRTHALEIWRFIQERDNQITNFHFEIGADLLGEEELEVLAEMRPGLVQFEIGVQSTNPKTLREIRRTMDLERLEHMVARINANGNIHQHLDLIVGLPYEDYQSFRCSFDRVYAMCPDQLQMGFLKVLKGSYMYEHAETYGLTYKDGPNYEVLYTKWITYEEIIQLKTVEKMLEMYYNSDQFGHTLKYFVSQYSSAFDFYKDLAVFYEQRNLQMQSSSRMAKYDLLLAFLSEIFPEKKAYAKEFLTMDWYAREKSKSRPTWAKDLTPYKNRIYQFYKQEENEPHELCEYKAYSARQMNNLVHIEIFTQIWESETAILFNYAQRNPRNQEAKMCKINI